MEIKSKSGKKDMYIYSVFKNQTSSPLGTYLVFALSSELQILKIKIQFNLLIKVIGTPYWMSPEIIS